MPIQYTNRKQKVLTLYQKPNKKGTLRYYFSEKPSEGATPVEQIPGGYEIYENVHSQVFLRKQKPALIFPNELALVKEIMDKHGGAKRYRVDVKGKQIIIYTPVEDVDFMLETFGIPSEAWQERVMRNIRWNDVMRFELIDSNKRTFQAQRYCYLGRIDDWIEIGVSAPLETVLRSFVPHIEQDSYFELF